MKKRVINARGADMSGTEPYKVPSMREIEAIPWNGYKVVSTFSGGGGSCLGYRMAGFHVVWANEFVEAAQETYRLNHRNTFLDTRDIRTILPEEILQQTGLKRGELDLFDGSPPCCAFSTAGKRDKGWGREREYSDGKKQQIENLFLEYIRILNGLQPKTFVAENVSGMVKGKAIGFFLEYIQEMKKCGYSVKAQLLNAKYLGVPQSRERIIFIGVRNDLRMEPTFPKPETRIISMGEAIAMVKNDSNELEMLFADANKYKWGKVLRKIPKDPRKSIQGSSVMNGAYFNLVRQSLYMPCSTICQMNGSSSASGNCHPLEDRKLTIEELKRVTSVPDDFILTGTYAQQWERLGRMVPPIMMSKVAKTIQTDILDKCK